MNIDTAPLMVYNLSNAFLSQSAIGEGLNRES